MGSIFNMGVSVTSGSHVRLPFKQHKWDGGSTLHQDGIDRRKAALDSQADSALNGYLEQCLWKVKAASVIMTTAPINYRLVYNNMITIWSIH